MKIAAVALILAFVSAPPELAAQTFRGYLCTDDCSGHEAGYRWAEEQSVTSSTDCSTNSDSFNEGCSAYVQENSPVEDEPGTEPAE